MKYCTRKWIAYLFTARHREGHGIHSPFLFRLITEVIENKGNFSAWPMLAAAEENVRNTLRMVDNASIKTYKTVKGSDCNVIKKLHLLPGKFDRLIFRLVNEFQPRSLSFYGSTFGVTLMAMALADRRTRLVAQVENDHYRSFCRRLIEVYDIGNIDLAGVGNVAASDFVVVQNPLNPDECSRVLAQICTTIGVYFVGIHICRNGSDGKVSKTAVQFSHLFVDFHRKKAAELLRFNFILSNISLIICN